MAEIEKRIIKETYFDEKKDCYIEVVEEMINGTKFIVINEFPKDGPTVDEIIRKDINGEALHK